MYMNSVDVLGLTREELEQLAMKRVCACMYYDLADTLEETSGEDLIKVIQHDYECDSCDLSE
jgi:predicted secreted protein